jgi:peroxiredoxin
MSYLLILGAIVFCLVAIPSLWLVWQLLRQNGRILLRLDELEKRLDELEFGDEHESGIDQSLVTSAATNGNGDDRANRFNNRSLARSKIKRDGLKGGTPAPDFRLPCLDGSEHSLQDFRGRPILLVFSDPHCGPCNHLAPKLEQFHRDTPDIAVLMISRGERKENRAKVKEHGLTFPILLQQQWEISRRYAIFATPVGYVIDESGIIAKDVAVGVEPILALLHERPKSFSDLAGEKKGEPQPATGSGRGKSGEWAGAWDRRRERYRWL